MNIKHQLNVQFVNSTIILCIDKNRFGKNGRWISREKVNEKGKYHGISRNHQAYFFLEFFIRFEYISNPI